tara:strand:- start:357 stop:743 length:387 start_codon:yes stop_codon:yes gene_type:complete
MFPDTKVAVLSDSLLDDINRLDETARAELFVAYAQKAGEVWMLQNSAGFFMLEHADETVLPVWPHRDLATAWAPQGAEKADAISIDLDTFKGTWLPGLAANNTALLIFPVQESDESMVMTADALAEQL